MSPSLTLGPVLDLIERWQQRQLLKEQLGAVPLRVGLMTVDVPAIRQLAEQHAAQLREAATFATLKTVREDELEWQKQMRVAADFLAAPRREPEAE